MSHVAICIVAFDNIGDVLGCLDSLALSTHADYHVVICENAGEDARARLIAALPASLPGGQAITVLPYQGNTGYAGGNNLCVAAAPDADAWWILNPDTRVRPDTMALLLAEIEAGRTHAIGGTLLKGDGTVQAYGGRWRPLLARAVSLGNGSPYSEAPFAADPGLDYIVGASMMFDRVFLDAVGPMRDDYFLYGEEIEWCLRAKAKGFAFGMQPRAIVCHAQGTTTGIGNRLAQRPRMPTYLDQRNKMLVLRDTAPHLLPVGAAGALAMLVVQAARHRAWSYLRHGISGWGAGVLGRRGRPDHLL